MSDKEPPRDRIVLDNPLPIEVGLDVQEHEPVSKDINQKHWPQTHEWLNEKKNTIKRIVATAALAGGLATGTYFIVHAETPDLKSVNITNVGRDVIDTGEESAPFILGAAGLETLLMVGSMSGRQNLKLALVGLGPSNPNFYRKLVAGSLLSTIGIAAVTNALMIEEGLRSVTDQNIQSMGQQIKSAAGSAGKGKQVVWGFQPGTYHFMDESSVTADTMAKIRANVDAHKINGVSAIQPFKMDLTTIPTNHNPRQAGLIISSENSNGHPSPINPKVKPGAICETVNERCVLQPNELIVDDKEGLFVGDKVKIHGQDFKVVGLSQESQSLINRLVAYAAIPEQSTPSEYYGFAALADSKTAVDNMIKKLLLTDQLSTESTAELLKYNKEFWSQNGTPLIMLMVGDIIIFAGATFLSTRRFEQERNKSLLAGLRAIGFSKHELAKQQRVRAGILTAKGILPAAVAAATSQQFINSLLTGFHAELKPEMLAASTMTVLAVQVAASTRSMRSINKGNIAEQMHEG